MGPKLKPISNQYFARRRGDAEKIKNIMSTENTPIPASAAAPTAAAAASSQPASSAAAASPGRATKAELNAAIAEADLIVASIAKLQSSINVNDTKFIAVTVSVASERLQEAQRYLRNKLPKAI